VIEKVVHRRPLNDPMARRRDLEFWLSRPPDERVQAVEILRRQWYGDPGRIQRVVRVLRRGM